MSDSGQRRPGKIPGRRPVRVLNTSVFRKAQEGISPSLVTVIPMELYRKFPPSPTTLRVAGAVVTAMGAENATLDISVEVWKVC